MQITIYAIRFNQNVWKEWEHSCNKGEVEAVVDSAKTKAFEYFRYRKPQYTDYLEGARYIFNVARGLPGNPVEGDTQVYGVQIDGTVVRQTEDLAQHFTQM